MNEKLIEELLNQAFAGGDGLMKFAELIVLECMDIVSKQTTLDTNEDFREGFSHGRKLAWTEIRKQFGVLE